MPNDFGVMKYRDGSSYNGQWEVGKRHGNGIMHYKNGDIYEGEWANDKRHGYGIFNILDRGVYEGEWEFDKMSGQGILSHVVNGQRMQFRGTWQNGEQVEGKSENMELIRDLKV